MTAPRTKRARMHAAEVRARLRNAGVPAVLSAHLAYYLSGGVVGRRDDHETDVPLAALCLRAPDAEAFLEDYRNALAALACGLHDRSRPCPECAS